MKDKRLRHVHIKPLFSVCLFLAVNILAGIADYTFGLRADVTSEQYTAISDETKREIGALENDIYIYYISGMERQDLLTEELLKSYARASRKIHYSVIDPNLPLLSGVADAQEGSVIVSGSDLLSPGAAGKSAVIKRDDIYIYSRGYASDIELCVYFAGERSVTSAIAYAGSFVQRRAVFLKGQDESAPSGMLLKDAQNIYYSTEYEGAEALDPALDTLVVIAPKKDISEQEYGSITRFLGAGGRAMFLLDSRGVQAGTLANLDLLLTQFGIKAESGFIACADPARTYKSPANIIVSISEEGAKLLSVDGKYSPVLSYASPIAFADTPGVIHTKLLETGSACYIKTDLSSVYSQEQGGKKSFVVGAAAIKGDAAIVVITSPSLAASEEYYAYKGNRDMFLNTLKFLSGGTKSAIPAKVLYTAGFDYGDALKTLLFVLTVGALPASVLIAGLRNWFKRRSI